MPSRFHDELDNLRDSLILRIIRVLQLIFAIAALGVSAASAADWNDLGCSVPSKTGYQVAVAVISILALIYLIATSGRPRINSIPWHHYGHLGLDVVLLILWIAAVATASLTCGDTCGACKGIGGAYDAGCGFFIDFGNTYCNCYFNTDAATCPAGYPPGYPYNDKSRRAVLEASSVFNKRATPASAAGRAFTGVRSGSQLGVDVIELILFIFTTAASAYFVFRLRNSNRSASASASPRVGGGQRWRWPRKPAPANTAPSAAPSAETKTTDDTGPSHTHMDKEHELTDSSHSEHQNPSTSHAQPPHQVQNYTGT